MKLINYLCVLIFIVSCSNKRDILDVKSSESIIDIAISEGLKNVNDELLLSDVAERIEIIPLETTNKSLFNHGKIKNLVVGQSDIFINTGDRILRFSRNGKYLQDIASSGQGPANFLHCTGIAIDDSAKMVYIASNLSIENKLKCYSYEGEYVKTIQFAESGIQIFGATNHRELRDYCIIEGHHLFRRQLPIMNPKESNWQIMMCDSSISQKLLIHDPASLLYDDLIRENSHMEIGNPRNTLYSFAPILDNYSGVVRFLFEANDTIYSYSFVNNKLMPKYILRSNNRFGFGDAHKIRKDQSYFDDFILAKDMLDSKYYLYIAVERGNYSYLLRFDKTNGDIKCIRKQGEIKFAETMKVHYRQIAEPEFTNDLCGGVTFYPDHKNEKEWITVYDSDYLLENINVEILREDNVVLPKERDALLNCITNLKCDDNPLVMIVKLK